ncbi:hypothetical protein L0F63_004381, partial [Massospora cicadina]
CRQCHQLPLSYANCDVLDIFNTMNKFNDVVYFSSPKITTEYKRLRIGTFLLALEQNFLREFNSRAKNNGTSTALHSGFFYFPAHDATLSSLLSILEFNQTNPPPYASNFILELWAPKPNSSHSTYKDQHKDYRIRFIYNSKPITPSWCDEGCTLKAPMAKLGEDLNIYTKDEVKVGSKLNLTEFDFKAECQI